MQINLFPNLSNSPIIKQKTSNFFLQPAKILFRFTIIMSFILIYFHADSAVDVNSIAQNTIQSDTARRRTAQVGIHKIVEQLETTSLSNDVKNRKGTDGY